MQNCYTGKMAFLYQITPSGNFYKHGLILISAWISNYIHCKAWGLNYLSIPKLSLGMDK